MVSFVVVGNFLHTPKAWDSRLIEWNVVGAVLFSQRRLGQTYFLGTRQRIHHAINRFSRVIISHEPDGQDFSSAAIVHQDGRDFLEFILMLRDVSLGTVEALFFTGK